MRKTLAFLLAVLVASGMTLLPARGQDKKTDKEKLKVNREDEVPFVPTDEKVVSAMLKLANVKEGETVYDLGCGDGRIVISAVADFKAKRGFGVDYDPARLADCDKSVKKAITDKRLTEETAKRLTFKQGDVTKLTAEDFKDVDVVTLYLLPAVNLKLMPVLQKGIKPGARIVSHDFDMGDWKADKLEEIKTDRGYDHKIYLWTIKKK
jgi:SAM-dependent methyltransferase